MSLSAKVEAWNRYVAEQQSSGGGGGAAVNLTAAVDLTVSPCAKRASFPYSILPPLRHVDFDTLVNEVLRLPDGRRTAVGGILWGAGIVAVYNWLTRRGASLPLRAVIGVLIAVLVARWVAGRAPVRQRISTSINVSSNPAGPCCVTGPVVTLTNSHAGTHADRPQHFMTSSELAGGVSPSTGAAFAAAAQAADFHPCCYTGEAVVLDIARALAARHSREIDEAVIDDALSRAGLAPGGERPTAIWRLVLCTKRLDEDAAANARDDKWTDNFAYLSKSGAEALAQRCPNLLLLATDAPSVDRVDASPIKHHAHGVLWKHRIAIVENVDCAAFYPAFEAQPQGRIDGSIQCVFNDAQKFDDARGCTVLFYKK